MIDMEERKITPKIDKRALAYEAKGWLYVLPALVIKLAFVVYPLVKAFRMAFYTKYNYLTEVGNGFGLKAFNYVITDVKFIYAMKNTLMVFAIGMPIAMVISLIIALLIDKRKTTYGFFQTVYFIPYVTSTIAIGVVFRAMFHFEYGYINYVLGWFGVSPIKWLSDPSIVIWSIIIFYIWSGLAFKVIVLLAGLKRIDTQVYKVAKVDGASPRRIFWRITLPLLSPTLWMLLIVSAIYVLKLYNEIFSLFNGNTGPADSAMTVSFYIYNMFYVRNQVNYAAAAAVIMFLLILGITLIQKRVAKKLTYY